MFKLSSIQDALTADIDLKHPVSGDPLGATLTLAGPEHPARKAFDHAKQRKQRAAFQKNGKIDLGDPAEDELNAIDMLVNATLGWSGFANDSGEAIAFTKDAAATLYSTEGHGWLRAQVLVAMGERDRFIKTSATA